MATPGGGAGIAAGASKMSAPTFPQLSQTYQSSYLWAPHHLKRVTINQSRYHDYVSHTLNAHPPHLNALHRRVQQYGDNRFYLHRDIPIQQAYSLTELRLSNLRPWDQLVDRPLSKDCRVLEKEFCLPFPTEHPYTSHISQFAVFPDTHTTHRHTGTTPQHHTHHRTIGTQITTMRVLQRPVTPYYVTQKAFEIGLRRERHPLFPQTSHVTSQDGCGQLWDLPRSRRHQRSQTYPAPKYQHTPSHQLTISPHTQEGLNTIHTLTAGTTSYKDHFGYSPPLHGVPNKPTHRPNSIDGGQILNGTRPVFSAISHSRPYTAESRSKYRGSLSLEKNWDVEEGEVEEDMITTTRDVATQTEPDDEYLYTLTTQDQSIPTESTVGPLTNLSDQKMPKHQPKEKIIKPRLSTSPSGTRFKTETETKDKNHHRSFSIDETSFRPRSSFTTQRFSEIYGFSRSDVQKQFHLQYPESAPDLRQYGIQKGKRHTIHGYNSYYFH